MLITTMSQMRITIMDLLKLAKKNTIKIVGNLKGNVRQLYEEKNQ